MGIDKRQRYLKDFLRIGRVGSVYFVTGAPDDLKGPHGTPQKARQVYDDIIKNFKDYEVVDRKVVRKSADDA